MIKSAQTKFNKKRALIERNGILYSTHLPNETLRANWDAIVIEREQRDRLLAQAILNFTVRPKVDSARIPLHGLIGLVGPPGTGKTSLARGLAAATSEALNCDDFLFVEVDPHALNSGTLGKTQKSVTDLLGSFKEYSAAGPIIVLLDEVETLAADRTKLSLEANPIDVHRATDAALAQLDHLAAHCPNLLFIATSNFPQAVDEAFMSRADLVMTIDLPSVDACRLIISDTIQELAKEFTSLQKLITDENLDILSRSAQGLDGRQIRKAVLSALTFSKELALHPEQLQFEDINKSLIHANGFSKQKGMGK